MKKVAIIGGGISGLSCAYQLKVLAEEKGEALQFVLLEKEGRFGGQILTEKKDNLTLEKGPDCFISTKPWAIELSKKLGIENRIINTNEKNKGTYVLSKGKLHPLPEGILLLVPTQFSPFVKSRLFSWPGKIRMGLDLFIPKGRAQDDESLANFVRRRLGQEVLDKLAEPLIGGIHASDPEKMSLKSTFPQILEMEKEHRSLILATIDGQKKMKQAMKAKKGSRSQEPRRTFFISYIDGMQEIIDALVASLDSKSLQLNTRVLEIQPVNLPDNKQKYRIEIEGEQPVEVDAVVLSTLPYTSADLMQNVDSRISEILNTIPSVSSATVSLAFKRDEVPASLNGFGFLVPSIEKKNIMAATFTSLKWHHRAPEIYFLMRVFIGGAKNQELVELDDSKIQKMILDELKSIIDINAQPFLTEICRWRKAMPQYTLGHYIRIKEIDDLIKSIPGVFLTGAGYQGVGIPDCIHRADQTAEQVLAYLGKERE